jgi:hypothetical protein
MPRSRDSTELSSCGDFREYSGSRLPYVASEELEVLGYLF